MITTAVILAAGRGNRLKPITNYCSKAMVRAVGKPLFRHVIDTMLPCGITKFFLVVSPDDAEIKEYIREIRDCGITVVEQKEKLGMAHALGLLSGKISGSFLMSCCDSFTSVSYIQQLVNNFVTSQGDIALSLIKGNEQQLAKSGVAVLNEGRITKIVEKPPLGQAPSDLISLALYVFSEKIFEYLLKIKLSDRGEYELQDAIQMMIDDKYVVTGALTDHRYEVTTVEDLLSLNLELLQKKGESSYSFYTHVRFIPPIYIGRDVQIGVGSTIGPNVVIEDNSTIGSMSTLSNCLIFKKSTIGDREVVEGEVRTP